MPSASDKYFLKANRARNGRCEEIGNVKMVDDTNARNLGLEVGS